MTLDRLMEAGLQREALLNVILNRVLTDVGGDFEKGDLVR